MLQKQVYTMIRKIVTLTFIISGCSGLIHGAFFNCSNYTFHENSTEGRSWETSRSLCQNSSEGDLVSIEEEEERNFVKNVIEKLAPIKYFIGLKKENGKWKWLTNRTKVHESKGKSPWALGEPSGTSIRGRKVNCATIYGNYMHDLGRFDDMSCRRRTKNAGHICERAVSCTKHERGTILKKKPTEVTSVHSTATTLSQVGLPSGHHTTEIESTSSRPRATKEQKKATPVRSTARTAWKNQPFLSTAETDSIAPVTTHLEKADESSNLIPIIVSALAAFVILGTCVALLLFLVYLPRKKGSNLKIQRYQRQSSSIKLIGLDRLSLAEQKMDDCESLPEVKRQDAYVTIEERDGGSFLSMQASSTITPREALIEKLSSANSYSDPLPISARTKPSKVVVKKDKPEQHQVYVHIHSKKDNAAFHLDHVMQHVGEWPSQVIVDEENCKPSAAISSVGLEKESVTREQDAIVKQNASGQDQCNDCVYAVVDKTMKKRQPGKEKPAPYQELVYANLSHSPKKSKNGKIHQESTATIYADIDHIKSSAMSDSTSQQENEVKLID